ncbi:ORF D-335 domain protein [Sulfolobus islandicus L.S.2.15]|uniref:ORF D-335 domain protein n=1 Tax=Saccharolobus islandicus (strain L.S.2.15 / Lassen \|nr:ORF D-335 domain protein [Sulfolobus islandicus L.S.2.15]
MGNKVFTFGDIRIREVKGKYYVYLIEKGDGGQRRDRYVGSLDKVVEIALGVWGNPPLCGRRDLNPGSPAWEAGVLIQPRLRPQFY